MTFEATHLVADSGLEVGIHFLNQGDYVKSEDFFKEKVTENKKDAAATYYLGLTCLMLKKYDQAIDRLEGAVQLNSRVAEYHFCLGKAVGIKAEASGVARQAWLAPRIIREFERAIELDPTHIEARVGAGNFYLQAPSILGGDLKKARIQAEKLLSIDEKQGRLLMIDIDIKAGELGRAEQELDKICQNPGSGYGFCTRYGYYLLGEKDYDKAISMFKRQVRLTPREAYAHSGLGDGYMAADKFEEASAEYETALKIDPTFEPAKNNLERLKKQIGEENTR